MRTEKRHYHLVLSDGAYNGAPEGIELPEGFDLGNSETWRGLPEGTLAADEGGGQ
jgi:hypothetical protein